MAKKNSIDIGYLDLPVGYSEFDDDQKKKICNNLIDMIFITVDKSLPKEINRITFVQEVFESSLITNELDENYEICMVIRDCIKQINES